MRCADKGGQVIHRLNVSGEGLPDALADVCREVGSETLIFCRSPQRTREVAGWLLDRGIGGGRDLAHAADWIAEAYHPGRLVARGLRQGVGIQGPRLHGFLEGEYRQDTALLEWLADDGREAPTRRTRSC